MVVISDLYQCVEEASNYLVIKEMMKDIDASEVGAVCSALKNRRDVIGYEISLQEGDLFDGSEKSKLFYSYMKYHMAVCVLEGKENYFEELPSDYRDVINKEKRDFGFLVNLIAKASSVQDIYDIVDVFNAGNKFADFSKLSRLHDNMIVYSPGYEIENEAEEHIASFGDMAAKYGFDNVFKKNYLFARVSEALEYIKRAHSPFPKM